MSKSPIALYTILNANNEEWYNGRMTEEVALDQAKAALKNNPGQGPYTIYKAVLRVESGDTPVWVRTLTG